ncbi:MAG: hypothetical protein Q7V00_10815 [Sulfurimicrobium sp.]|nr:hypothetical protein [Sulfurimicrobium sp.]MDP2197953.1 hypothetical protein [Sulfurimicrobium sp.]
MQVELLKPHTHASTVYPPGGVIALDEDLAKWLVDTGIARPTSDHQTPKPINRNEEKSK